MNNQDSSSSRVEDRARTPALAGLRRTKVTKDGINRESRNNGVKVTIIDILAILADSGLNNVVFCHFRNPRFHQIPRDSDSRDTESGLFLGRNRAFRPKVVIPALLLGFFSPRGPGGLFAIFLLSLLPVIDHFCHFWTTFINVLD